MSRAPTHRTGGGGHLISHSDMNVHYGKPVPTNKLKTFHGRNGEVKIIKKATRTKDGSPIKDGKPISKGAA